MTADGGDVGKVTPLRTRRSCPECGKPAIRETWPFCSERCKQLDLGRWLSGSYAIPVSEADDQPDEFSDTGGADGADRR